LDGDLFLRLGLKKCFVHLDVCDEESLDFDVVLPELVAGFLESLCLQFRAAVHELEGSLIAGLVPERCIDERVCDLLDEVVHASDRAITNGASSAGIRMISLTSTSSWKPSIEVTF